MAMQNLDFWVHQAKILAPSADIAHGDPASLSVSLADHDKCQLGLIVEAADPGRFSLQLEAGDQDRQDFEAIPFEYSTLTGAEHSGGEPRSKAPAEGIVSDGLAKAYVIPLRSDHLAAMGKTTARLKLTETVDGAVAGVALAQAWDARFPGYKGLEAA